MKTRPIPRLVWRATTLAGAVFVLSICNSGVAVCQNEQGRRNECAISDNLKALKSPDGTYTEAAKRQNVEGSVILCVTVDGQGKVTDVSPTSGPQELLQSSVDAVRKWEFEPPTKVPAHARIEMKYSMTKACPEGKGMDTGDIVTTIVPTEEHEGDLKILGELYQPLPPYPEAARADRVRGQLYLSIVVNPDGSVSDVQTVRHLDELLDNPAVKTVRTWRFKVSPGTKPTRFSVTLSFRTPCLDGR